MLTSEDEPFWEADGDDMTLEMITDVNDGEVDEDVRVLCSNELVSHDSSARNVLDARRIGGRS